MYASAAAPAEAMQFSPNTGVTVTFLPLPSDLEGVVGKVRILSSVFEISDRQRFIQRFVEHRQSLGFQRK